MRSAITPPKVNRFGENLENPEQTVVGWPRQILSAIRAVARVWEAGEICSCLANNAPFCRFFVGNVSRNLNTTTSIGEKVKTLGTEFWQFYRNGSFFQKTQKFLNIFLGLATSRRHNSAMITDRLKLSTKIAFYWMSSFYFTVRINS